VNGSVQDSCTPGPASGISETICNGDDDDCDGAVDEDYTADSSCGEGVCQTNNTPSTCVGGVETPCQAGSPTETPAEVTCDDGADNDCDGLTDSADPDCPTCVPTGADNNCNGVDEDCINGADDGYVPVSTSCGTGVCAANGSTSCVNGSVEDSCTPGPASGISETICNGDDDDCDGAVDEDYTADSSCGVGVCGAPNNTPSTCVDGVETPCQEGSPTETPETTCDDGVDNDCDGQADTADADCPVTECSTYTTKQPCNGDVNCKWNKNLLVCEDRHD
jgi:hypothetical protein